MQKKPLPAAGLTRRALFKQAGLGVLGVSALDLLGGESSAYAAPAPAAPSPPAALNRFPRTVQEYFVRRVREVEQAAKNRHAALRSKADAAAYVREVREKVRRCFGPLPEKTPLNARVTGVVERDAYRIEKVIFESRPGFLVTANLYVPKGVSFPRPGVVGACGHNAEGKAAPAYQSFGQSLARLGYVALVFDPLGQGERMQYPGPDLKSRVGGAVLEHLLAGNQQSLVGEWLGTWRAWDGIRALDFLLTRPEVDARHLGVTGTSGGGTDTTWLCAMEPRWTMAAPSCFITTFRRNLENELPADPEQYPPGALALGLDMADFLVPMAPKPVAILANLNDYFDLRGAREAYERLRRLYALLDAEQNVSLSVAPTEHGFSQPNREGMYRWFTRVTGAAGDVQEPALTLEKAETLWCTPRGQVVEQGSRTVFFFTRQKSRALAASRKPLAGEALVRAVQDLLHLPPSAGAPDFRVLRRSTGRRYPKPFSATYAVETEPGIHALVYLLADEAVFSPPPLDTRRAVLYVSHQSSDAELRDEPLPRELLAAEPAAAFYTCDVRGVGESRPNTCGLDAYAPYGSDYCYAGHALMIDYPYIGQKTHDVLRVLDWLKACGHSGVHLAANGWGTVPATFAALLSPLVVQVTLKNAPASYAEVAQTEMYDWPLSAIVPNVLATFDLPDCYAALRAKQLRQVHGGA